MPHKEPRRRVEPGLYRAGKTYLACATPPGQRRPRFKSLGQVGLMEARRLRDEFRVEIRSGRAPQSAADTRATFDLVAGDWLARQEQLVAVGELSQRTYDAYESATRLHLLPFFAGRRARSIGPDELVYWHATQRASSASAWSIKGRWTALRLILAHAARAGQIDHNPADLLERRERPHPGKPRRRFLTGAEMHRLLSAADARHRPLIASCLFTGLRLSEALGLTWQDIDLAAGRIRVRHQLSRHGARVKIKTPAGNRDVVLMPALAHVLREHKLASHYSGATDPIFATATRRTISARNASRAFDRTVKSAGLEQVTFHVLRHTFASLLIDQGRDPVFVADQLGHADPGITMRTYAHLFRAARHAEEAQAALDAEYGHLLRRSET